MITEATQLGALYMSSDRQYEMQRTNHFEVYIAGLGEEFVLSVESVTLPKYSIDPIDLSRGNDSVKVPGKVTLENQQIVVRDVIKIDMEDRIEKWRSKVFDPKTGKMGWVDEYKKEGYLYQYGPDGTHIRAWKIEGCWPRDVDISEFSYENAEVKKLTLDLCVDKMTLVR